MTKAIQIRYLSATNHRGARIKVWAEGVKPLIVGRQYASDFSQQGYVMACEYVKQLGRGTITGYGMLPNGDYCATFGISSYYDEVK